MKQNNKGELWTANPCYRIKGAFKMKTKSKPMFEKNCFILRILHALSEKVTAPELH